MSYQPDINPSSPTGQNLQAAIQKELAFRGWSTEDDTVMAEYCLVMLGNRKTQDQISTELSDLIGTEFEPSFVSWLFTEVTRHYPDPSLAATTPAPTSTIVSDDARWGGVRGAAAAGRRASGPGGSAVFGQALSGVKRDSGGFEGRDGPNQRVRTNGNGPFEGVPAGPRFGGAPNGGNGRGGPSQGRRNDNDGKSLFDRIGSGSTNGSVPFQQMTPQMPPQAFDAIQSTIDAVIRGGAHPSALASIPYAALAAHPSAAFLDPRVLAQAQAHAMAQAQAFAAMQQASWNNSANGAAFGNGGVHNPAFAPQNTFGVPGGLGFPGAPPRRQGGQQGGPAQQKKPYVPKVAVVVPLPTKPLETEICKHGVDCSKPTCPYSHPSPVATKQSGLVLSSESCEKGLSCDDLDCAKSHVSASQKKSPAPSAPAAAASQRPVANNDPSSIPGAGEKVCKFAGACTRKGCVFLHPWDIRGDAAATGGVVCRWAENCTRADCHFSHPPSRVAVYSGPKPTTYKPKSSPYSATFNNPKNPSIGAWPTEKPTHVSDRLKRFNVVEEGGETVENGGVERIIPGEDKGDKVEIELEDHSAEKAVKEEAVAAVLSA